VLVKLVADVASAMKVLAKRQQLGAEIQAKAHEIETYAMAKLGSMTKDMPKAQGAKGLGKPKSAVPDQYRTQPATYADLGLDKKSLGWSCFFALHCHAGPFTSSMAADQTLSIRPRQSATLGASRACARLASSRTQPRTGAWPFGLGAPGF